MEIVLALVIGVVFAAGVHLLLQRDFFRAVLGVALLSTATNLIVFVAGGLTRGAPAIVADGEVVPASQVADPLPQALVLTAIVIGLGLFVFTVALAIRKRADLGTLSQRTSLAPTTESDLDTQAA